MTPDDVSRRPASAPRSGDGWSLTPAKNDTVVAVLGPTNTGKTHYAVERMLGHKNGVIGFPLRLLAREVYDRIAAMRGPRDVALITGEEKIVPPDARFYICTVESMPLDWGAEFVAVDEIQLCADPERGHIFTDRLLHARGRSETLFLGAATMWDRIASLAPGARFVTRDRLSELSYSGAKKISRLPARSAIVGFSVDNVYAIAELIRRQKGGAAVVMGALSPRTRNAQVALYQEGDVDYLVATDAIGMGLNLDVKHVAFSGLRKFDGKRHRWLEPNELAQIAGRAGRHTNNGTFGVTGEASPLDDDVVQAIENHRFKLVERVQWRNARLDYGTPFNLMLSLEREPGQRDLQKAREADDLLALRHLARMPDILDIASGRSRVRLLWDVCQIPDFRKTMPSEHAALLAEIYRFLSSEAGVVPEDWIATQCARLERVEGDIDALSKRLAYIRTWTYVANRGRWLADPGHWREKTRHIEDQLSDALHQRLTQRFVDRRTSVLARRLKEKEALVATVDDTGAVTVEGEFVGRLEGFRFEPDPSAAGAEVKTLQAASAQALQSELGRRVEKFYSAPDGEIDVTEQGGMMWGDAAVGRLDPPADNASDPFAVRAVAFADEMLEPALKEKIERRLQFWIDRKIQTAFEPLLALKADEAVTGMARGVAFQLLERYGVIPRPLIADDLKALAQDQRGLLRKHGVRFGQHTVFIPALLKPAPTRLRILLWGLAWRVGEIPSAPPPGAVTIPAVSLDLPPNGVRDYYAMAGYRLCGSRALRIDMLERLADMLRNQDARGGFEATPEMMSITGSTLEQLADLLEGLGFAGERGERPKQPKPKTTEPKAADAEPAAPAAEATAETGEAAAASDAPADDAPQDSAAPSAEASLPETAVEAEATAPEAAAPDATPPEATPPAATDDHTPETGAEAPQAPVAEAPAETPVEAAPGAEPETADTPEQIAEAEAPADSAEAPADLADPATPAEMEVFYTFRLAPRRRRGGRPDAAEGGERGQNRRGGGRQRRGGPEGAAAAAEGGAQAGGGAAPSGERQDAGPQGKRGPKRGGKGGPKGGDRGFDKHFDKSGGDRRGPKPGGGHKPKEFRSGPGRGGGGGGRNDRIDPDSPFAVLQRLKDKS